MNAYKTNTDWTRNKNSTSIIYMSADGTITEITLETFLAESPSNTVEKFKQIKTLSDKLFQREDSAERERAKHELPLIKHDIYKTATRRYICPKNKETMLMLTSKILNKLTETQRRRFLLHKVSGLTTRKIAALEGVAQQVVFKSIKGAEKKIKKYLSKSEKSI